MDILGTPNIGIYALTTNNYTIVPPTISQGSAKRLKEYLMGEIIRTCIYGTRLTGIFGVANSNGIVLPYFVSDDEVMAMRTVLPVNVGRIRSKITAFGNLILVNDKGGIVSEILLEEKGLLGKIKEILDVELVPGEIAGLQSVGSVAVTTNKGALVHPMLRDEERKLLKEVLKVNVDVGTINGGYPFVASGILANDHGVIMGNLTTGPETLIISNILE
ncbi:MAG: translation initiation factor IF-6 [Candidatus Bathyarchaeota archaeon]